MENALLYFFSTIAQVLAAVIALVFVFIIFKFQDFDKAIDVLCKDFASILGNNVTNGFNWQRLGTSGEFMTNYKSKYFTGMSNIMDKICNERDVDNKEAVDHLKKVLDKTRLLEDNRLKIIGGVKFICLLGFSLIIASILLIPFVKNISINCILMDSLIFGFIILTAISLLRVYKLLSISLTR